MVAVGASAYYRAATFFRLMISAPAIVVPVARRQGAGQSRRRMLALALLSCGIVLAFVLPTPISVYNDPTFQLKALQQYRAGASPTFNTLVMAGPRELSRDTQTWISTWPPGMGTLLLPLLRAGLGIGGALRALAAAAFIVGSLGWAWWISLFDLPRWLQGILVLGWPCVRYANNPLFQYYTESLTYALAPWLLVGAVWLAAQMKKDLNGPRAAGALALGVGLGAAYWLKYSAVFVSVGLLMFFCCRWLRARGDVGSRTSVLLVLVALVPFITLVAGLNLLNRHMGASANYVSETAAVNLSWRNAVDALGFLPLAMADLDSALQYVFFKPSRPLPFDPVWLRILALPVALLILWILLRRRSDDPAVGASRWVTFATMAAIFAVWTLSGTGASHEARHIAAAAMAMVPALLAEARLIWRRAWWLRSAILLVTVVFVFLPMLYGAATVVGKWRRVPRNYETSGPGLYHPSLASLNESATLRILLQDYSPAQDVWYAPDGVTALFLPGRMVIRQADFQPLERLRSEVFRTAVPLRVLVLLPRHFEQDGKGIAIRSSFVQAKQWRKLEVPGCDYIRWAAELQ